MTQHLQQQCDAICRQFRKAWKSGPRPSIDDYLSKIDTDSRATLFRNLLDIEIKRRFLAGEFPGSPEYTSRFPDFVSEIRQVFEESTLGTEEGDAASADPSVVSMPTQAFDGVMPDFLGDYEILRELGTGGFGNVYEARHTHRGNRVALKTLKTAQMGQEINAEQLHKFRKEFRSLSEINHPNLVGMQSLEVSKNQWFFTMDLIEGDDFLSHVRPRGELNEKRLRRALAQLAGGIIALHDLRIVHRDLKPSNVMVDKGGTVKILDFGLVAQLQTKTDATVSRSGMFAGTPKYAAPEQMFGERSEASDWYAFGVMLYEALKGDPPFIGSQMDLMRQKQSENPPLIAGDKLLPSDLAQLADCLLKREPSQRACISQITDALQFHQISSSQGSRLATSSGISRESASSTNEDLTGELDLFAEENLVLHGRENQLLNLEQCRQEFLNLNEPLVIWISGKSGEGKSSLVEKFLRPLRQGDEMVVLSGRCYDRESVPFKAIDSIIEPLVSLLRSPRGQEFAADLPPGMHYLAHLFPLLKRVIKVDQRTPNSLASREPEKVRGPAFNALRELLLAISTRWPIALFIDDLQWADSDSARVWHGLLSSLESPRLMFLGSYRSDESGGSHFLQAWSEMESTSQKSLQSRDMKVEPLNEKQCIALAAQRTGLSREQLVEHVAELFESSGGNPYLLDQLLAMVDPESGSIRNIPLDKIITERLVNLPAESYDLLKVTAVSGQPIALKEACEAVGFDGQQLGTVVHMRSERLLRLLGDDDHILVETYHDRIREAVLDGMDPNEKINWHLRLAEIIESREVTTGDELLAETEKNFADDRFLEIPLTRIFDLAFHFHKADHPRAFAYQLLAGMQALNAFAPEEALEYLETAKEFCPLDLEQSITFCLWQNLGQAQLLSKKNADSRLSFEKALALASTGYQRGVVLFGIGKGWEYQGEFIQAVTFFDRALAAIGSARPKTVFGKTIRSFLLLSYLSLMPLKWHRLRKSLAVRREVLAGDIYSHITFLGQDTPQPLDHAFGQVEMVWAALKAGGRKQRLAASTFLKLIWFLKTGISFKEIDSFEMEETESPEYCRIHLLLGYYFGMKAQMKKCLEYFAKSRISSAKIGEYHTEVISHYQACHFSRAVVETGEAIRLARILLDEISHGNDSRARCYGHYLLAAALAQAGRPNEAMCHIRNALLLVAGKQMVCLESVCLGVAGQVCLLASHESLAGDYLRKSWGLAESYKSYYEFMLASLPPLLCFLSGSDWHRWSSKPNRHELQRILSRSKWHRRGSWLQPQFLRSQGRAYCSLGKKKQGIKLFEKAIASARNLNFQYELGLSLLDLAAVEKLNCETNRAEAIQLLKKLNSVMPRAESWMLGDQYDESVVAPKFDQIAWEKNDAAPQAESSGNDAPSNLVSTNPREGSPGNSWNSGTS